VYCINDIQKLIGWGDCCFMPSEQYFSHIMARTSYISMRWLCLFCARPTWQVVFLYCSLQQ